MSLLCPCGSNLPYHSCCELLHKGQEAISPDALMRSRYSAFVLHDIEYLLQSWHPSTRPEALQLDEGSQWLKLSVLGSEQQESKGRVHFKAYVKDGNELFMLEEDSSFVFENGHWLYVDGQTQFDKINLKRNDECLCGSGKKFKKCCSS